MAIAGSPFAPLLVDLLGHASIEIAPGRPHAIAALHDQFDPGTEVFVNFLPNGDHRIVADTAARLRRTGFVPVPHVSARSIADRAMLADFLQRVVGEAGVGRILVVAGDRAKPAGPFTSSLDLLATGLFEAAGIAGIGVAGHPEGHPLVATAVLDAALNDKRDYAARAGLDFFIVTQFAFEAQPILAWLARQRAAGMTGPVRIGVAGPASLAALIKFAVRCGIGNSLRTLRLRTNMVGRLIADARPDDILHDLGLGLASEGAGAVGLHFFPFGGVEKTGAFISETLSRLYGEIARAAG